MRFPSPDNEAVRKDTEANYKRIEAEMKDTIQQQIRLHQQNEDTLRRELKKEKQSRVASMKKSRREASEREERMKRDFEERLAIESAIFENKLRKVKDAQALARTSGAVPESPSRSWSRSPSSHTISHTISDGSHTISDRSHTISDGSSSYRARSLSPHFLSQLWGDEDIGDKRKDCPVCGEALAEEEIEICELCSHGKDVRL